MPTRQGKHHLAGSCSAKDGPASLESALPSVSPAPFPVGSPDPWFFLPARNPPPSPLAPHACACLCLPVSALPQSLEQWNVPSTAPDLILDPLRRLLLLLHLASPLLLITSPSLPGPRAHLHHHHRVRRVESTLPPELHRLGRPTQLVARLYV